ncbi:hypothetical protein BJY24_007727 [Nocardia transvalensis]|uniref:Uncharacterized protein n=1 Tax=Nocardia transvalensis TaxID=37333 RepID=A0A7W9PMC0_9NOCA|nr:hypothetical protein [Nocardia transvalensis]
MPEKGDPHGIVPHDKGTRCRSRNEGPRPWLTLIGVGATKALLDYLLSRFDPFGR